MGEVIYYICIPLGYLIKWCHMLVSNYGLAIVLFTLLTKIILLPLSIWIQKNSILMVKIQPEVNFLKARLMGNMDAIADEQSKLFKREHYHPMLSLIPLILQLVLLMGVVQNIYNPLTYLFSISGETITEMANFIGADLSSSSYELDIVEAVKNGLITESSGITGVTPEILSAIKSLDLNFLGMNLTRNPSVAVGLYLLVPVIAGLSSFFVSLTQNQSNVIQHEQSKWNQYGIMALSVGLSLYLGLFVPCGIAVYWTASNLMSIAQMYLLNVAINPKKFVDYEALEESRKALLEAKKFGETDKKDQKYKENKKREKRDYALFKSVKGKHVVFYSERSGFYKYYKGIISELLDRSNLTVHYVTNDPNDVIFEVAKSNPKIKPYYIGLKKLSLLMMLLEADIFVMTTPALDKYYLKRSFVKKDVEYIYVPHDMMSVHMGFTEGAFDAFDTVFCTGRHVIEELREIEKVYKTPRKKLFEFGYPLADNLVEDGRKANENKVANNKKQILIAPSWQEDNLLDSVIDELIAGLYKDEYKLIVRPHPEYLKRFGAKLDALVKKYADYDKEKLVFELDFSSNESIYTSDLIITDWSGIAPEFCFATKRPAVFVNTKIKAPNENWQKINKTPVEISLRKIIGVDVDKKDVKNIDKVVAELFSKSKEYEKTIEETFENFIFNHGCSSKMGAKYILYSLAKKRGLNVEKNKDGE